MMGTLGLMGNVGEGEGYRCGDCSGETVGTSGIFLVGG